MNASPVLSIDGPLGFDMNASPTIVLVPGAFHLQASMDVLKSQLTALGCNVQTIGLPTVNNPKLTIKDDVNALEGQLLHPLIEQQGKDIVLYLHSYAGFPGSTAIAGYSKAERLAGGKLGGILGLIYQSAFIPKPGDTLFKMIGSNFAPWQSPNVGQHELSSILLLHRFMDANCSSRH